MKKMFDEFKKFIMRGNVLDMAVGVIVAGAFGKITTSLVNDLFMPFISWIFGTRDMTALNVIVRPEIVNEAGEVTQAAIVIGFGTFINILLCGNVVDFCTGDMIPGFALLPDFRGLPMAESFVLRLILCVLSLIPAAYGMYIYMSAKLGSGPRDGLMCVLKRRAVKMPVGLVRVLLEGCALTIGWLLGGTVGLGTIILVLLSGPVMQVIFKLHKFDVQELRNETIPETIAAVKKALAKNA